MIYYNINTEEKLKQLIDSKLIQIEEGQSFFIEVYEKVKDYDRDQISDASSNLYQDLFPIIQRSVLTI